MLRVRQLAAVLLIVVFALLGAAWFFSPIDPVAWTPPPMPPLTGAFEPNEKLKSVEWWAKELIGPEAVTIAPDGALLAGLKDGRVVKLRVGSDAPELVVDTKGRPLAMEFHPDGRLIICDAHGGLLAWSPSSGLETLATGHGGVPFRFVDDLAIAKDGTIYFTDASSRRSIEGFTEELLEHQPTGRVLRYVPSTKELTRIADGFAFTNGIALSGDESFLVVAETGGYRLWRLWLQGEHAGRKEIFTDALPGFPDNVRWSPTRKGFWVAVGSLRKPEVDLLADWPNVRRIAGSLPKALMPKAGRHAYVLFVDGEGQPVDNVQYAAPDSYSPIACATEHDGWLYLGSFAREGVARFKLP
ncbi:MAG TPA: SMP-30/gluconolactonase/LRE family protein [Archangium sp.]